MVFRNLEAIGALKKLNKREVPRTIIQKKYMITLHSTAGNARKVSENTAACICTN